MRFEPGDRARRGLSGRPHEEPGQGLAHPHAGGVPRRPPEGDDLLGGVEVRDQRVVLPRLVRLRPRGGVDARGRVRADGPHEVRMDRLRGERHERGHHPVRRVEAFVEGQVGGLLVLAGRRLPEPPAVAAHVPVAELVDEGFDRPARALRVVSVEARGHRPDRPLEEGDDPAVDLRPAVERDVRRDVHLVEAGVEHEEGVGVPPGVEEGLGDLAHEVDRDPLLCAGRDPGREVPAERVRPHPVEDVPRVDDVADRLGHLLPVLVHDVAEADAVAVGHAVRDEGGDGVQGVEPAPGLVHRLADVVGGEAFLEPGPVLEGPVPLGVGHRARIEPAVDDLRRPPVGAAVLRVGELDPVHRRAVQVDVPERPPAERFELRPRADAEEVAGPVRPHREGGAPEPFARQRPVHVVLEPVAEAPVADVLRHPVDGPVELHEPVAPGGGADVPGVLRVVDERVAGAPAVRVVVRVGPGPVEAPALAQEVDEHRVGVLEEEARHRPDLREEVAVEPDPVQHGEPVLHPEPQVVGPVGGRGVDDPGAVPGRHEVRGPHPMGRAGRLRPGGEVVEGRLVAKPRERAPLDGPLDRRPRRPLPERRLDRGGGEDEGLVAVPHPRIVHVRVHGEGEVGGEGPGGGGPDEERDPAAVLAAALARARSRRRLRPRPRRQPRPGAGGRRLVDERETDVDGRVLDLLVAERDLVRGQGRPDPGVVGNHLVPAVEKALVPDGLQEMPHRLDVVVVEGVVGVGHVHPEAHALGHALPVADVAHDRLAAAPGELLDPDLALDAGLVEDPELLLDLVLDGQAVGVPAGAARAVVAAHGLVAGEQVLEGAGEDVVEPRPPVRGRRTLVPDVEGAALGLALAGLEHLVGAPPLEDLLLDAHAVVAAVDFAKVHDALPGRRGPQVC